MLIPALDLINGAVVRLKQGDFAQQTTFHDDPLPVAKAYADAGAKWLHIVDLDGARDTAKRQLQLIQQLANATSMQCQVGGGIRTRDDVQNLLNAGVARVVIGSTAVKQPQLVQQWLRDFGPEAIVIAIDVNIDTEGRPFVAIDGWRETSELTLTEVLEPLLEAGCRHVLCTDISRDGMLSGCNVALYKQLKEDYPQVAWQASGGVAGLDDLHQLQFVNCDAAILGKALLTGKFTLEEALACWPNA